VHVHVGYHYANIKVVENDCQSPLKP